MRCPRCQHENPATVKFCGECGARLDVACAACRAPNPAGNKFCHECGASMGQPASGPQPAPESYTPKHLAEKILTSKTALEGEHKQVTVLFCDIANSTETAERVGPEVMHRLLSAFFELALAEVHRYEGTINQFLGDGFMALFGAPLSHEDHARRAVLAALGIQRALREASTTGDGDLSVRMGLNTGFVVVGAIGDNLRMDYTAVGDTTHLAARLQQLAPPGVILVGETTARLVTGYVRLAALDPVSIKGVGAAVPLYRLEGLGRRRSPLDGIDVQQLTPFVGRDREAAALRELLSQVEAGEGRIVGIVGEPGVGKSRLLLEFRRSIADRPITFLEGRCLSFGSTIPYLPIVDIIRNNCGIVETDPPDAVDKKVRFGLEEVGLRADEHAPFVLHLLGIHDGTEPLGALSAEAIKARTFETLRLMALNGSQQRPLVFAIEDAHWIDRTSQEFLESLAESLGGTPLLLLATFRPGYRPAWTERSYASQFSLQRLTASDSLSVVRSVLSLGRAGEDTTRLILEKAEGNPLFLEEMARAMAEGRDVGARVAVPDTVHGILMARIDRLPDEAKRLLQTAAVLGREFTIRLLAAVWDGGAFDQHLLDLKRMEFLYERTPGGEPGYVFKHALTQDVAYESLLESRRRMLHAAAGRAIEAQHAGRLEEVYERLAYHYGRTEDPEKAVQYLVGSSEKAARVYANADAVKALQDALGRVDQLPTGERDRWRLDIVLRLAHSQFFVGALADTLGLLLRHQEQVERLDNPLLSGPFYFWLGHTYSYLTQAEKASECAYRALAEAARANDEPTAGKAHYLIARTAFGATPREGVEHGMQAIPLLEGSGQWSWLGQAWWALGTNYTILGDFDQALAAHQRAAEVASAHGDTRVPTVADWAAGLVCAYTGEWQRGVALCERSLANSRDPITTAAALGSMGWIYVSQRDDVRAVPLLEESVARFRQIGYTYAVATFGAMLSEALCLAGQTRRAREVAREGMALASEAKLWYQLAQNERMLGLIESAEGSFAKAAPYLQQAWQRFLSVEARFEAPRTQLDLAEVMHRSGRRDDCISHLTVARDTFAGLRLSSGPATLAFATNSIERAERLAETLGITLPPTSAGGGLPGSIGGT